MTWHHPTHMSSHPLLHSLPSQLIMSDRTTFKCCNIEVAFYIHLSPCLVWWHYSQTLVPMSSVVIWLQDTCHHVLLDDYQTLVPMSGEVTWLPDTHHHVWHRYMTSIHFHPVTSDKGFVCSACHHTFCWGTHRLVELLEIEGFMSHGNLHLE